MRQQLLSGKTVATCSHCGKKSPLISQSLGVCLDCIRRDFGKVSQIAAFMSSLNHDIPYALLAFHPDFLMGDLPTTSAYHAQEALEAARAQELGRVRIGNIHLLGDAC